VSTVPAPSRRRRRTHLVAAAFGGLVLLAILAGPAALAGTSLGHAALGRTDCASAADDSKVGLVIDYGTVGLPGEPTTAPSAACVPFPSGTGLALLVAAGHTVRTKTTGSGDMVCGIDGYPQDGCGVQTADGFQYWSYWLGGTSWSFSGIGAGSRNPKPGDVDGWRFVSGVGQGTDKQPRAASTNPCTTTTTTAPATTTTTGGPGGGGGPSAGGGGGGSRPPFQVTPTIKAGTSGETTIEPGSTGDTIRGERLTESDTGTSLDGEGFADPNSPGSTNPDGSRNEQASDAPSGGGGSGSGVPIAIAGGGVVIVALGVTAALRFRAEPED